MAEWGKGFATKPGFDPQNPPHGKEEVTPESFALTSPCIPRHKHTLINKYNPKLCVEEAKVLVCGCHPSMWSLRQEDFSEFKVSLGYRVRSCLKRNK